MRVAWVGVLLVAALLVPSVAAEAGEQQEPESMLLCVPYTPVCVSTCLPDVVNYCLPPRPHCIPAYVEVDPDAPSAWPVVSWGCVEAFEQFVWYIVSP